MHTCRTYLTLLILLTNVFVNEAINDSDVQAAVDIDENDSEIEAYKKSKLSRPSVFQNKAERIVGGNETTIEKYPFIVSFQDVGYNHLCGGSIIHERWVLTASHCITECASDPCSKQLIRNPSDYLIVAGATDARPMEWGEVREILEFVKHPGFGRPLLHNDIALIKIKNPFQFCKSVNLIVLPKLNKLDGRDVSESYKECLALGWGARKRRTGKKEEDLTEQEKNDIMTDLVAPILMVVSLPTIPIKLCKYLINDKYITNRHLCTMFSQGGRDACEGDSGGPLVCNEELYGVTSWGHGCALPNTPGIFTRVDTYTEWIQNILSGKPNVDYYSTSNKIMFFNSILFLNIFLLIETVVTYLS